MIPLTFFLAKASVKTEYKPAFHLIKFFFASVHPVEITNPIQTQSIVEQIFATRRISRKDQQILMRLFSQSSISASDKAKIDLVYEALQQGLLRVID